MRKPPPLIVKEYRKTRDFEREARRMAERGYRVQNAVDRQQRVGIVRVGTIGALALFFKPKPKLLVTYELVAAESKAGGKRDRTRGESVSIAPMLAPPAAYVPTQGEAPTCPACGAAMAPDARFCGRCGQSLAPLTDLVPAVRTDRRRRW